MNRSTTVPVRGRLFRDLYSAELSLEAYRNLWQVVDLLTAADHGRARNEITKREADRLRSLVDEFEADADDCRAAILSAGLTPDEYDRWRAVQDQAEAGRPGAVAADMAAGRPIGSGPGTLPAGVEPLGDADDVELCPDCSAPTVWDEERQTYRHHGAGCWLASSSGWIVL